jgi:hypothetical protein
MYNTVSNKNVGSENASIVHKDTPVVDGDGQVCTVHSLERSSVLQTRAVARDTTDNSMVRKDISDLLSGEVSKSGTDGLESRVVRREDSDVRCVVDGAREVGRVERTTERSQSSSAESVGSTYGQSKDMINNVNHTASEVDVLKFVNESSRVLNVRSTYSLRDSRVVLKSAEEGNVAVAQLRPDPLASSYLFTNVRILFESHLSM